MHILIIPSEHYVTESFPLGAIFQHDQAKALREAGMKTGVISAGFIPFKMMLKPYVYLPFENDNGINTYKYYQRTLVPGRIAQRIFSMYLVKLYLLLFEKYIKDQGMPDIIHAHNCLYAGVAAWKMKEGFGIPYVITEHSSAYARGLISERQAYLTREVLRHADVKTFVSTKLGELMESRFGEDARPNFTVFNILDARFEREENIYQRYEMKKKLFIFLNVGSLDDIKNHAVLLDAFCKFKNNPMVQMKIIGDGPLRKSLEQKIREKGMGEQVFLTGRLDRESVFHEMQNCNAFVLASKYETFGVVLIEALACGIPVIATKCGGPEDIVGDDNGILCRSGDVIGMEKAMVEIYSNIARYDPKLIRNGCISRFGREAFVKRMEKIYALILEKAKKRI